MAIDDRLKGIIEERLASGAYRGLGALYDDLFAEGLYLSSKTFFSIEVRRVKPKIPEGFGKKKNRILNRASLEHLLENKEAAIKRAKDIKMGYTDIAYFTDATCLFVHKTIRRYGPMRAKKFEAGRVGYGRNMRHIYYKHAAQVYEQIASGNSPEEIQRALNLTEQAYTFLIENRNKIEPVIVTALQKMYDCPTHSVPYVTSELRRHLNAA